MMTIGAMSGLSPGARNLAARYQNTKTESFDGMMTAAASKLSMMERNTSTISKEQTVIFDERFTLSPEQRNDALNQLSDLSRKVLSSIKEGKSDVSLNQWDHLVKELNKIGLLSDEDSNVLSMDNSGLIPTDVWDNMAQCSMQTGNSSLWMKRFGLYQDDDGELKDCLGIPFKREDGRKSRDKDAEAIDVFDMIEQRIDTYQALRRMMARNAPENDMARERFFSPVENRTDAYIRMRQLLYRLIEQ